MTATEGADSLRNDRVVDIINPAGEGRVVLICEHASNTIPAKLDALGLNKSARQSHIAWDLGALALAKAMSVEFDAPLIARCVSRRVYNCNRPPNVPSAIPEQSEIYSIPGDFALSPAEIQSRVVDYYMPFQDTLATYLDRRSAAKKLTPIYDGIRRDVDVGVLHDEDTRLADALLEVLSDNSTWIVRRNEPYGPKDGVTHTLIEHALPRAWLNVMLEIRNDLLSDEKDQMAVAEALSRSLIEAIADLNRVID